MRTNRFKSYIYHCPKNYTHRFKQSLHFIDLWWRFFISDVICHGLATASGTFRNFILYLPCQSTRNQQICSHFWGFRKLVTQDQCQNFTETHLSLWQNSHFSTYIDALRHKKGGRHIADGIFKYILVIENFCTVLQKLGICVSGSVDNILALIQAFFGAKPSPELMFFIVSDVKMAILYDNLTSVKLVIIHGDVLFYLVCRFVIQWVSMWFWNTFAWAEKDSKNVKYSNDTDCKRQ